MELKLINDDCLNAMDKLIEKGEKVDAIITDPPYGTTACKWDSIIPFNEMWPRLNALIKDNGAIVLFGSEPFTSTLICSNLKMFKYNWIWVKNKSTGFLNAKRQPLNDNETISVFYKKQCLYNPQMIKTNKVYKRGYIHRKQTDCYGELKDFLMKDKGERYPKRTQYFNNNYTRTQLHPTQKPVSLLKYLVKTYTNENETVLDFTMGSGTTGVACKELNRNFIGIEINKEYFETAKKRIEIAGMQQKLF